MKATVFIRCLNLEQNEERSGHQVKQRSCTHWGSHDLSNLLTFVSSLTESFSSEAPPTSGSSLLVKKLTHWFSLHLGPFEMVP